MVEFAIVLPVLLLLVFGIIQFGILFNHYLTLPTRYGPARRQGSRQPDTSGDPAARRQRRRRRALCMLPAR